MFSHPILTSRRSKAPLFLLYKVTYSSLSISKKLTSVAKIEYNFFLVSPLIPYYLLLKRPRAHKMTCIPKIES